MVLPCISNLRQIATAELNYTSDWNDTFPIACDIEDKHDYPTIYGGDKARHVWEVVHPYVKSKGMWRCPGDIGFTFVGPPNEQIKNSFREFGSSYSWRVALSYQSENRDLRGQIRKTQVSQVKYPQRCLLNCDIWQYISNARYYNGGWHVKKHPILSWNIVYVDGHTGNVSGADFKSPKDLPQPNNCGYGLWCDYYLTGKCGR